MSKLYVLFTYSILFSLFMVAIIYIFNYRFDTLLLLPDIGASWYYWKMPVRDNINMTIVWIMYLAHQISIWYLILKQKSDFSLSRTTLLLFVNAFFILLHFVKTHIIYDGLAQDTPIYSSQVSVIILLVLVLILRNEKRGLFFGLRIGGFKDIKDYIKKYHGIYISWAIVYTFWFHPAVSTNGHLIGFFYMFLLFIQMSFMKTKIHTNRYWIAFLEIAVLIHGTIVAIGQGNGMWPMFLFGFGLIGVCTQIYDLGLKKHYIFLIQFLYLIGVIYVYGFSDIKVFQEVHQITWIPVIEYGLVFVLLIVGNVIIKTKKLIKN